MASSAHHYEPPRLPTFQERRRAKELQQASKQQDTSTSPINRWAVRDPRTPPLRDSPSVPAIVLPGPGVALSPDILARGQSQGPTLGRKPLPQPLPGRGRMQSQSPHMVPFSPNMAINPMQSCQPPLPPPIITALSTLSLGAAPSPPMSPMSPIPPPIPSSSRPLPQPTSFRPHPSPQSSYQTSPHPFLIQHTPHTPASALADHTPTFDPFMARSDTLTSIKSLDRVDMTPQGTRPLPRPPVGVGPSKSLDRGMGDGNTGAGAGDGEASAFQARRRLAKRSSRSTIIEEERSTSSSHGAEGSGFILESAPLIVVVPHISFGNDEEEDTVSATSANSAALAESIPSSNIPSFSLPDIPTISLPTFSFSADDDNDGDTKEPNSPPSIPTIEETLPKRLTHQTSQSGPGLFCAACDNVILGRVLTAMECRWHPDCFRCEACGMLLEHVSSYENGGKAYCHMDYHERFAPKCYHCETPIIDSRFVTIDDPDPSKGVRCYHELHFFCGECGDPFLDPSKSSAAGTEASRIASGEGGDETKDFVLHGKYAFCVECDVKLHKPKCRACRKPIKDEAVETMGMKWHKDCFRCAECHNTFANNCFFPKEGRALCQECFTG